MKKNNYLNTIGKRIRTLRNDKRLSLKSMAEDMLVAYGDKISESTISRIENDNELPSADFLVAIANSTNFVESPNRILFGTDSKEVGKLKHLINISRTSAYATFIQFCEEVISNMELDAPDINIDDDSDICDCSLRIKEIRKYCGFKVAEIAKICGISDKSFYKKETSPDLPSTKFLMDFCRATGVSADYILLNDFLDLPSELRCFLGDFSYASQMILISKFTEIAKNLSLL